MKIGTRITSPGTYFSRTRLKWFIIKKCTGEKCTRTMKRGGWKRENERRVAKEKNSAFSSFKFSSSTKSILLFNPVGKCVDSRKATKACWCLPQLQLLISLNSILRIENTEGEGLRYKSYESLEYIHTFILYIYI